jgi:hypothetical protein
MHSLIYIFAYHVDSTTLADGDYGLIPDQAVEVSEDPENVIKGLTEVPNQSSKNTNTIAPTPCKKASPGHNPLLYLHCNLYYLYISLSIKFLGVVWKP